MRVAAMPESFVELINFLISVGGSRAEVSNTEYLAKDEAREDSLRVGGVWWNVQIQVLFFLVNSGVELAIDNCNCKVHEVDTCRKIRALPIQPVPAIQILFVLFK